MEDDWLEAAYEERYENDLEEWETQQVFLDREHDTDFPLDEDWDEDPLTADEYGLDDPDPNPLGVDIDEAAEGIYGGDGHGSGDARQLMVIQRLADRSTNTPQERLMLLDADVRDAMARARKRLVDEAMKYSTQGFEWDEDDVAYTHAGLGRTITATLRIARNGA